MKKLKFSPQDREKLIAEFSKKLDEYESEMGDGEVSFDIKAKEPAKEKLVIYFTPEAYLRSQMLVKEYTGEVGWHGLIRKLSPVSYLVYDIIVYPQVVNGARTLDPTKTNEWYEKYVDELEFMHFQAHSHVNMTTTPSSTDTAYFTNTVKNLQGEGFYLFQIWNKSGDINSFFYDLDSNLLYDKSDIEIRIQDSKFESIDRFIADSKKLVEDMKPFNNVTKLEPKTEKKEAVRYHWQNPFEKKEANIANPFYWSNGYAEGWDDV